MRFLQEAREALLQLFFPHICAGCGTDNLGKDTEICMRCAASLPATGFTRHPGNPVEKIFWGRLPLLAATATYYFTKGSLMQELLHRLKYKEHPALGLQLGRFMGEILIGSERFTADALVPLPLHPERERKRGYNQSRLLCDGLAAVLHIPVWADVVGRPLFTQTQTRKGRVERWKNMEGRFALQEETALRNKHVLLVDDVITTGATLEACGLELLKVPGLTLSVAALCYADR